MRLLFNYAIKFLWISCQIRLWWGIVTKLDFYHWKQSYKIKHKYPCSPPPLSAGNKTCAFAELGKDFMLAKTLTTTFAYRSTITYFMREKFNPAVLLL